MITTTTKILLKDVMLHTFITFAHPSCKSDSLFSLTNPVVVCKLLLGLILLGELLISDISFRVLV